ncbi:MAG: S1C family serine protease [Faecousia sp.]
MDEQNNKYSPKYSRDNDPWDDGSWQTGFTQPPKDRGSIMAFLLILIIFLFGIITVLGILNVKLFTQLQVQKKENTSISFTPESEQQQAKNVDILETTPDTMPESTMPLSVCSEDVSIFIQESPEGVENIPQNQGLSLQEIYELNIPSVVSISCRTRSGSSSGTGVILSSQGYIVTNAHVVDNAVSVSVQLTDDRTFQASLVGADDISDLAVLYIDADNLTPAQFGDSSALRVGDTVAAIGDPLGVEFRGSFTDGIISAINRDVTIDGRTMSLIQTNAALNSGNSGGPLINCYGQVIGINTMKIGVFTNNSGVEGLGFAIPSSLVKDVVDQIIHQGYVSGRPTLGITGDVLSNFYQHYYRLPSGLYITQVAEGSYAEYYGISPGDILLSIDDQRITDMDSLNSVLYSHQVGDVVTVVIYRGGQQYSVELTLTENKG